MLRKKLPKQFQNNFGNVQICNFEKVQKQDPKWSKMTHIVSIFQRSFINLYLKVYQKLGPCLKIMPKQFLNSPKKIEKDQKTTYLQNVLKCPKNVQIIYPTGKKQIYIPGKRSYIPGLICKLFHFALSLLNSEIAITPERVARLT